MAKIKQVVKFTSASSKSRRIRRLKEKLIELVLFFAAASSVFVTLAIIWILFFESIPFFKHVSIKEFLTEKEWTPLFAQAKYGILPLLMGTIMTSTVALLIAIPVGTSIALYLSEFASNRQREVIKPILELLAAVPTVVYGYFALLFVTPILQKIFTDMSGFNVLSAGIVMGVMIIPYISSLAEDALRAVPQFLREGSYALGASKLETGIRVIFPAAFSGITSAYILGISRAIGETMVVTIAAGMQPNFTFNPLEPSETMTAYIVQVSLGDLPHGSIGYQTIYVVGLTLFLVTFFFNVIGFFVRKKFREVSM